MQRYVGLFMIAKTVQSYQLFQWKMYSMITYIHVIICPRMPWSLQSLQSLGKVRQCDCAFEALHFLLPILICTYQVLTTTNHTAPLPTKLIFFPFGAASPLPVGLGGVPRSPLPPHQHSTAPRISASLEGRAGVKDCAEDAAERVVRVGRGYRAIQVAVITRGCRPVCSAGRMSPARNEALHQTRLYCTCRSDPTTPTTGRPAPTGMARVDGRGGGTCC